MAYLVLPEDRGRQERLIQAHWIVNQSLPRRARDEPADEVYRRLRQQVLRRALHPPRRTRARLGPWLRLQPAVTSTDEDQALAEEIARLEPHERTAYVLLRVESMTEDDARDLLARLEVADPQAALRAAAAVDERVAPGDQATLLARPPMDPTITRLYGRRARPAMSRPILAVGGALLAAALVAGVSFATGHPWAGARDHIHGGAHDGAHGGRHGAGGADRVTTVGAEVWKRTTRLDLDTWPTRGDLAGDGGFVKEALRAWSRPSGAATFDQAAGGPPDSAPHLLYAGTVGADRVALLHDSARVARYTTGGSGTRLEIYPEGRLLPGGASPLKLAPGRLLLPPWVTGVKAAALDGGDADWAQVPVRGGVTEALPRPHKPGGCWRGPVLELQQPSIAHGRPYTLADLGGLQAANIMYQPPPPAPVRRLGPHQIDGAPEAIPFGFELWGRLACSGAGPGVVADRGGSVESAMAWEFWAGDLPDGGGRGHWVCTRYTLGSGRSATYALLLDGRGATLTGRRSDTWDCSRLQRDVASGTWWRSPKGRWFYLAAASRRVVALSADGPFSRPAVKKGFLIAEGPRSGAAPSGKITVSAVNYDQKPMPVYQAEHGNPHSPGAPIRAQRQIP
ncbi:hypothetical protein [Spirillospora sp. NPDC047279]|uniref:hypothetical protein n=1 Tax=Spirillospora sp. NPDC047279 TaxID=3155478 RepID=UPI0033F58032